jgi:RNA recognition motif-containing protein
MCWRRRASRSRRIQYLGGAQFRSQDLDELDDLDDNEAEEEDERNATTIFIRNLPFTAITNACVGVVGLPEADESSTSGALSFVVKDYTCVPDDDEEDEDLDELDDLDDDEAEEEDERNATTIFIRNLPLYLGGAQFRSQGLHVRTVAVQSGF